ncbi:hypothetical protein LOK49_LG07G00748 [Camellia lanceoleosa]|uniref:Uncharacterized protein n=1 Tax=Camellia lanceoleosa TaxID=1840588 RepID=A0ACC0H067_9ERIC|nr:hypothetical protein LOK49_LG07G00748 [Camellia lanceoleosa]
MYCGAADTTRHVVFFKFSSQEDSRHFRRYPSKRPKRFIHSTFIKGVEPGKPRNALLSDLPCNSTTTQATKLILFIWVLDCFLSKHGTVWWRRFCFFEYL